MIEMCSAFEMCFTAHTKKPHIVPQTNAPEKAEISIIVLNRQHYNYPESGLQVIMHN